MSGLLPSETSFNLEDGFLPGGLAVQIIHGQHRKIVLEMVIAKHLGLITADKPVQGFKQLSEAEMTKIHTAKDAWWLVNLYDACESDLNYT